MVYSLLLLSRCWYTGCDLMSFFIYFSSSLWDRTFTVHIKAAGSSETLIVTYRVTPRVALCLVSADFLAPLSVRIRHWNLTKVMSPEGRRRYITVDPEVKRRGWNRAQCFVTSSGVCPGWPSSRVTFSCMQSGTGWGNCGACRRLTEDESSRRRTGKK